MKKSLCSGILALVLSVGSAHANSGYFCEVKPVGTNGGFIQKQMVLILADDQKSATVIDAMILALEEKPLPARVRPTSRGTLRIAWNIFDIPVRGSATVNGRFSAEFNPNSRAITVRSNIENAANFERGKGSCNTLSEDQLKQALRRR